MERKCQQQGNGKNNKMSHSGVTDERHHPYKWETGGRKVTTITMTLAVQATNYVNPHLHTPSHKTIFSHVPIVTDTNHRIYASVLTYIVRQSTTGNYP